MTGYLQRLLDTVPSAPTRGALAVGPASADASPLVALDQRLAEIPDAAIAMPEPTPPAPRARAAPNSAFDAPVEAPTPLSHGLNGVERPVAPASRVAPPPTPSPSDASPLGAALEPFIANSLSRERVSAPDGQALLVKETNRAIAELAAEPKKAPATPRPLSRETEPPREASPAPATRPPPTKALSWPIAQEDFELIDPAPPAAEPALAPRSGAADASPAPVVRARPASPKSVAPKSVAPKSVSSKPAAPKPVAATPASPRSLAPQFSASQSSASQSSAERRAPEPREREVVERIVERVVERPTGPEPAPLPRTAAEASVIGPIRGLSPGRWRSGAF